jgi:hypothetical protein
LLAAEGADLDGDETLESNNELGSFAREVSAAGLQRSWLVNT